MINEWIIGICLGVISCLIGIFLISICGNQNWFSYHKICLYVFLTSALINIFFPEQHLFLVISAVSLWFVQNRISDLIKATKVVNFIMYRYVEYLEDSKSIRIRNCVLKEDIINSELSLCIKESIEYEDFVNFLHEVRNLYDDYFNYYCNKNHNDKDTLFSKCRECVAFGNPIKTNLKFKKYDRYQKLINWSLFKIF